MSIAQSYGGLVSIVQIHERLDSFVDADAGAFH